MQCENLVFYHYSLFCSCSGSVDCLFRKFYSGNQFGWWLRNVLQYPINWIAKAISVRRRGARQKDWITVN